VTHNQKLDDEADLLSQCFDVASKVNQVDEEIKDLLFGSGQSAQDMRPAAPSTESTSHDPSEAEIDAILNKIGSKDELIRQSSKKSSDLERKKMA
jgi:hypothetical protein